MKKFNLGHISNLTVISPYQAVRQPSALPNLKIFHCITVYKADKPLEIMQIFHMKRNDLKMSCCEQCYIYKHTTFIKKVFKEYDVNMMFCLKRKKGFRNSEGLQFLHF